MLLQRDILYPSCSSVSNTDLLSVAAPEKYIYAISLSLSLPVSSLDTVKRANDLTITFCRESFSELFSIIQSGRVI